MKCTCRHFTRCGVVWPPDGGAVPVFHLSVGSWQGWREKKRLATLIHPCFTLSHSWPREAGAAAAGWGARRTAYFRAGVDLVVIISWVSCCLSPLAIVRRWSRGSSRIGIRRRLLWHFFFSPLGFCFCQHPTLLFFSFTFFFPAWTLGLSCDVLPAHLDDARVPRDGRRE